MRTPTSVIGHYRRYDTPRMGKQPELLDRDVEEYAKAALAANEDNGASLEVLRAKYQKLVRHVSCGPEFIDRRGSFLLEFPGETAPGRIGCMRHAYEFGKERASGASWSQRAKVFTELSRDAAEHLMTKEVLSGPDDHVDELIHVSCTGYTSPSALQEVAAKHGWVDGTRVTHIYHMGCYAAMPALREADAAVAAKLRNGGSGARAHVEVMHTEYCTLHFSPEHRSADSIIGHSLFADGVIAYRVSDPTSDPEAVFGVLAEREELVPESKDDMSWVFSDDCFKMALSRNIPNSISSRLQGFIATLAQEAGVDFETLMEKAIWAIHPGGPKIIRELVKLIGLKDHQVAATWAILREHGNMSSGTVPHVLQRISEDPTVVPGTPVITLAFGPGLTLAGAMLVRLGQKPQELPANQS